MDSLIDIIKYLYDNYPHRDELSKARLVKMIYLADWRSAITNSKQITSVNWYFNHYGPYVEDIINEIRNDDNFKIIPTVNYYGQEKELIKICEDKKLEYSLSNETKEVIDFVIDTTKSLYWDEFIKLVYSTYPIASEDRYSELDLVKLAEEYKNTK